MTLNEISLGRSVTYNFYDIYALVKQREGRPGLTIRLRNDRPAETRKSGIYVWKHPDWGYFYVGIAAADNFTARWHKHVQKLLDQCTSAAQMHNWKQFADRFRAAGYGIDDLKDVQLRFYPITTVAAWQQRTVEGRTQSHRRPTHRLVKSCLQLSTRCYQAQCHQISSSEDTKHTLGPLWCVAGCWPD